MIAALLVPLWFRFVSVLIISPYFLCLMTWLLKSALCIKGFLPGAPSVLISTGESFGCVELCRLKRYHFEIW